MKSSTAYTASNEHSNLLTSRLAARRLLMTQTKYWCRRGERAELWARSVFAGFFDVGGGFFHDSVSCLGAAIAGAKPRPGQIAHGAVASVLLQSGCGGGSAVGRLAWRSLADHWMGRRSPSPGRYTD